ncbi:MAG: TonB-dependent receptor [Woeseiaceae bacterium]|nr:TonB-dependent receptor [Woeseiaceae bacterium]
MKQNPKFWLFAVVLFFSPWVGAEVVIDEITVTADYRGRSLVDVPFSVSSMSEDFISEVAVQHFEELVNLVPNMNWSGDGHRARYFQIRGVGELEQYQGAPNPSIGFLIDDIDFSGIGSIATLFDIQTVEVLRGPQGSRYGANALGGLIYMRSTDPSAQRNGRLQFTAGDDDALSFAAAFGGSFNGSESASYRLSAQKYQSNGFRDNPFLNRNDTNGRDETSLRARLHFEPSKTVDIDLSLLYSNIDNGYDAFSLDNSNTVLSDNPGKDAQESLGAAIRLDWRAFGDTTATSITSFADSSIDFGFDADWGNDESWAPVTYDYVSINDRTRRTVSQEFRLGSEQWLIGLYALNLVDEILTVNLGDYYDPYYDWADSLDDRFGSDYEANSVALFGQYDHDFSSATRFSAGLRLEHRSTDYLDTGGLSTAPSEAMWGGEIGMSHDFDALTAYVSLAKGYKAGGFNLGAVPAGKRDFDSEAMWTIEMGVKALLLDSRLQMNAAVFQYRRDEQQVRTSTQLIPGDPASFVFFTDNLGEGKALGVEVDARWFPIDDWEFYVSLGLINATLQSGREQAHAPPFSAAAGIAYRNPNGFFARLDAVAKDAFYFDVSHDQKSEPYHILNTRIGFDLESWMLSLWARNLFDQKYAVRGFYFGNEPPDFPDALYTRSGDPRQIGVTIEKRF